MYCGKRFLPGHPGTSPFTLSSSSLVNSVKDMGIMINSDLKFDHHLAVVARGNKLGNLIHKCFCSRDTLLKVYVTYVRSLLEYASIMWSPYTFKFTCPVESVQRHFRPTKHLPGCGRFIYSDRLTTLGLESLEIQ